MKFSGFNHENQKGHPEWLTPPELIRALGEFDLDPCSPVVRPWPTAKNHFTIQENGLIRPWTGRCFVNPPYGNETHKWLARCAEHKNVTALIFARTETKQFFDHIWGKAHAVCFLKGRLSFYHVDGTKGGTAGSPSMLVAWDEDNASAIQLALAEGKLKGFLVKI